MPKDWIEIKAHGPRERAGEASIFLIGAGSPGLVEDSPARLDVLVSHSTWSSADFEAADASPEAAFKAYIEPKHEDRLPQLKKDLRRIGWEFTVSAFKDRDWSACWKASIRPIRIARPGGSIIVKPTWRAVKKGPRDIVIEMDPGMAFGTGGHATTKMCIKAIVGVLAKKEPGAAKGLLDIGTGTGILAIAAKKLRVKKAVGIDIDPVALKVARKNARLNEVEVTVSAAPIERIRGAYPIVAANILANELERLAPLISSRVRAGGYLILSGILLHETRKVTDVYAGCGLEPVKTYRSGEWAALVFKAAHR